MSSTTGTGSISSAGIGSGLDVKSIVSQLVAVEKQPLVALQTAESSIQSKISTYGQIKSLVSTFADAASKLTLDSGWNNLTVASSNSSAVNATVSGFASTGNYSFSVSKLAQAQTSVTGAVPAGTALGDGTITLTVGSGSPVTISVGGTDDTSLTGIASKINGAGAGVTASVITDSTGQRLMVRSTATGAASAFSISATSSGGSTGTSLSDLSFTTTQAAQDTVAKINGVDVTSSNRTFSDTIPGLTFTASSVTTGDVDISVSADTATTTKNIQAFVDAYNAVNTILSTNTAYNADTKTAGLLQGDSTTVGLENQLRNMMMSMTKSGGAYSTLSDIGISLQQGGSLTVDSTKLASALSTTSGQNDVKALFATTTSGSDATNGIAVKLKALTTDLLGLDGTFANKSDALAAQDKANLAQQDAVNAHADAVQTQLNAQYTALDTQMASLTALNTYISQQVTAWNKST